MRVSFEGCVFDSDTRQVSKDGIVTPLSPKAFALLEILIRDRPKAISKEELRGHLWPSTFVSEANLANLVVELRAALGDQARQPRIIRTVARFGYSFCTEAVLERPGLGTSTPVKAPGLAYRLIWGRREIALEAGENLIGRDQRAVIWIDDEPVSRRHARIVIGDQEAVLEDLGSKNGTYLQGERIRKAAPLADKDALKIGPASMVFRVFRRTGSTRSSMRSGAAP
jgi:DNA-binding winged helix-turn-helix (wHTH) protein